mmetsp:Transcript_26293/g.77145  ORF Transcript_26293/g.77145 Transcript_26293/m.77145 type:complete len:289 (-) Transcript_26293:151-1017(-)
MDVSDEAVDTRGMRPADLVTRKEVDKFLRKGDQELLEVLVGARVLREVDADRHVEEAREEHAGASLGVLVLGGEVFDDALLPLVDVEAVAVVEVQELLHAVDLVERGHGGEEHLQLVARLLAELAGVLVIQAVAAVVAVAVVEVGGVVEEIVQVPDHAHALRAVPAIRVGASAVARVPRLRARVAFVVPGGGVVPAGEVLLDAVHDPDHRVGDGHLPARVPRGADLQVQRVLDLRLGERAHPELFHVAQPEVLEHEAPEDALELCEEPLVALEVVLREVQRLGHLRRE